MHTRRFTGPALPVALAVQLLVGPVIADDGHNHGAAPAPTAGAARPRFAASSERFELVGVVNGKQLTVYLDRFDDNTPVKGARLDLELGGTKLALVELTDGEFEGSLAQNLKPGLTPVTAMVVAGKDSDLLAADIDVHAEALAAPDGGRGWKAYAGWALGALAALVLLAIASRHARAGRRAGGAA